MVPFRMNDQRSTYEQLKDLVAVANKEGLYDAADWLQTELGRWEAKWGRTAAAFSKRGYVEHVKGHRNSQGELAEWVIKSHETGKILSSHKSQGAAKKHLQDMHAHSGSKISKAEQHSRYFRRP